MCHCTEYKPSALQVRLSQENKLSVVHNCNELHNITQQFITAKISGCALIQGSETRSSLRQSNLQLQNEAALRSRQIHWRCAAGLAGADPGLRDRILLNYTRIENVYKVRKKTLVFVMYRSPQARNQEGAKPPLESFCPLRKNCWTYILKLLDIVKKMPPS